METRNISLQSVKQIEEYELQQHQTTVNKRQPRFKKMERKVLIEILKYLGLVVGCIAKFTSGSLFVFNVYQNVIKSTFNYTQTEVELLSSMLNVGLGTGILPGMLYDRLGPTVTSGAGLVITGGAYLLIWSTTKSVDFYQSRSGLMSFYFYLAGFGSLFSYMAALNTNVINFPAKHRGKVISLLNAWFTGSPAIFALLYFHLFSKDDYTLVENQDYAGYMLFFAILFISMNLLCMICLHDVTKLDNSITELPNVQQSDGTITSSIPDSKSENMGTRKDNSIKFMTLLKDPSYHLLTYSFALSAIIGLATTNNITVVTKSSHLSHYDSALLIGMPIMNTVISFAIGPLSDKLKHRIPRLTFFLISCIMFTITALIYVFFGDQLAGIVTSLVTVGIGIGILWSLVPTITSEMFGTAEFGRNWGLMLMIAGVLGLGGQAMFGALYDSMITVSGELYCYGKDCFVYGFIVMTVFGVIAIILSAIVDIRQRFREKYNQIL